MDNYEIFGLTCISTLLWAAFGVAFIATNKERWRAALLYAIATILALLIPIGGALLTIPAFACIGALLTVGLIIYVLFERIKLWLLT